MSNNLPPIVTIFNGINYNSQFFNNQTNGLTYDQGIKLFLTYPNAQGNEISNYNMTINGEFNSNGPATFTDDVTLNGNLILNSQITTKKRIYQQLNAAWPSVNGYYELAQDAFPLPSKSANAYKAVSSWDLRTLNTSQWFGICWSPEKLLFVATAQTGTTNRIATSQDAITWTIRSSPNNTSTYRNVVWSNEANIFVIVGTSNTSTDSISYSNDAINWSSLTPPNTSNWFNITYSKELNLFVAVSDFAVSNVYIMTSSDGLNWTNRITPGTITALRSVCWSAELSLFIAVGSSGTDRVYKSLDGINWSIVQIANTQGWYSVIWCKELNLFVACSNSGSSSDIMISKDGDNWILQSTPSSSSGYRSISWSPQLGIFCCIGIGTNNKIIISQDGITWSQVSNSNYDWRNITWSAELGIFCSVSTSAVSNSVMTSQLQYRPVSNNNFSNSVYNNIDSLGNWSFKVKSLFSSDSDISLLPLTNLNINNKNITNANTIYLNDNSIANMLLKYVDSTGELGFTTTKTGGKYNFYSFDGSTNISIMELQQTQIIPKLNMNFAANINLTFASGSGLITQATPISGTTTTNTFRQSNFISNFGAGTSANQTAQMYDTLTGRGLNFIVNAGSGSYNPVVGLNDCLITNRFRPTGESVGISIATQNSVGNGIRILSPNDNQAQIILRAGAFNTIVLSNFTTNPISVNDRIYMGGSATSLRRIDNVSILNLYDTSNASGTFELLVDSPTTSVQYRSLTNSYYHTFYVTNSLSLINPRFTIADGNISTIGCPFHVRTATTTTRLEFNPQLDASTDFFGTNSSSLNSSINIKLRNSANAIITTQVFSPTLITENVPTNTTSVSPSLSSQNGYVGTNVYTSGSITSSTTIGNFFSYTFTDVGTYSVSINRHLSNADGSQITVNQWYTGFSATINTLDLPSSGTLYSTSTLRQYSFTIPALTDLPTGSGSMMLRINAANTTIYFNGFISHTASNLGLRVMMSFAKIY